MIVRSLRLRNFRNYENAEVHFDPGMNVLTGMNAQGKTNILESLVYLSLTRSHRISDDRKLIRHDAPFADIKCVFTDERDKEIEAVIHPKGKTLFVYHQPVKKSSEFIGLLNVILFAPDDLRIFNDQPRDRRRMMNQEITKVSVEYLLSLNRFQNFLKERNLLLKQQRIDDIYLRILDEQMSEAEEYIIRERKEFIDMINLHIGKFYYALSSENADLKVVYKCALEEDISKQNLIRKHEESRKKDLEYRVTNFGIHHEDILFMMNDRNLVQTASQGQKRMALLAFKLSLMKYIEAKTRKKPVLLLDDVLSELDTEKQKRLLKLVSEPYQCLITATELPEFIRHIPMKQFRVENGSITEITGGI